MTGKVSYDAELPAFQAIPLDAIKKPALPIKQFINEAELIHRWVQTDKQALLKSGLDWALVDALPARTDALRYAEARWGTERFSHEAARKEWEERSLKGYELRDLLLHHMRFAFRQDEILAKRVAAIADGTGHADMVQDLSDLAALGEGRTDALAAVGVDPALLDEAARLSDELGTLLASATEEKMLGNSLRVLRDQAYTHLKQAVDKIREHGQYVFWKNPQRLEGYHSLYLRKLNAGRNNGKDESPSNPPAPLPEATEA